ncbi:MAG: type IX secretion system membrane protein PorP/SprF [Reichenbachiella sp.]
MKNHQYIILLAVMIVISRPVEAQFDPHTAQYLTNQSMINPAYVGVHPMTIVMMSSRGQWVGIEGSPWTHTLSATSQLSETMGGGVLIINDRYGINNNLDAMAQFSYKIKWLDESSLSFGLQGGLNSINVNYQDLDQEINDPNISNDRQSQQSANFGLGLFYQHDEFYIGVSVPKLLRPNYPGQVATSTAWYKRHAYLSAGYVFSRSSIFKLKPSILVKIVENDKLQYDLNCQAIIMEDVWLGVSIRNLNALGFNFMYDEGGARFGYAYEVPINELAAASYGTHELMFSIEFTMLKKHKMTRRYY